MQLHLNLLILALCVVTARASTHLNVGLFLSAPFVEQNQGNFRGFVIDALDQIASKQSLTYNFTLVESVSRGLALAQGNHIDMLAGPLTVTGSRQQTYCDFTYPFFRTGLQILAKHQNLHNDFGLILKPFGSLVWMMWAIIFLAFGFSVLLFERVIGKNKVYAAPKPIMQAAFRAAFWGISALLGRKGEVPKSYPGRVMAIGLFVISVLFISSYTASLSAYLTTAGNEFSINSPEDLPGKRVPAVGQQTSATWLRYRSGGAKTVPVASLDEAVKLANDDAVDALVYDSPQLLYLLQKEKFNEAWRTVGSLFDMQNYAFCMSKSLPQAKQELLNEGVVHFMDPEGQYSVLYDKWIGDGEPLPKRHTLISVNSVGPALAIVWAAAFCIALVAWQVMKTYEKKQVIKDKAAATVGAVGRSAAATVGAVGKLVRHPSSMAVKRAEKPGDMERRPTSPADGVDSEAGGSGNGSGDGSPANVSQV